MANTVKIADTTTLGETMHYIKTVCINGANDLIINDLLQKIDYTKPLEKQVFDLVYNTAVYVPDANGKQNIQTVRRTIESKQANCVNYSILIGAMLIKLRIPFYFKVVSFNGSDYEHIYIQTEKGVLMDCCLSQKQDGTDTFENRPQQGSFNQQIKYKSKILYPMPQLNIINGTNVINGLPKIGRSKYTRTRHNDPALNSWFSDAGKWFDKTFLTPASNIASSGLNFVGNLFNAGSTVAGKAGSITDSLLGVNQQQTQQTYIPPVQQDNTIMFVAIGGIGLVGAYFLLKPKRRR